VRHVVNERYDEGMFSSVVAGISVLKPGVEAFFLLPADMPLVSSHTIRLVARHYKRTGADIVYPAFEGTRGHPPLISARLQTAITGWNGTGGLRLLLAQYENNACNVPVLDEGVLLDIDTPEDYAMVADRYLRRHVPSGNICEAIMRKLEVPELVARHGRMVAEVAGRLAGRLNQAGLALDVGLVMAAGLLHDLAKGRPNHARHGARILKSLGYPEAAEIVAAHTDIAQGEGVILNEAAIVYLADKLVRQDKIVSVYERFQGAMEKFAADAAALAAVNDRLAKAQVIISQMEQLLGAELEKIIAAESPVLQAVPER
jgi:HD superfamily phosphodiesterase